MMKSIKGIGSVLGFDLSSLSLNANGGIYQSADLSRYSGTVVNRPTFFAFAKGAGVMGEAGPEAILPLRRGADGKLGVVADTDGNHSHSLSGTAASAGAHAHTVGIGAHTHSVAIGSHGHTITVNAAGNAENTVKNIAFNYIVRLA